MARPRLRGCPQWGRRARGRNLASQYLSVSTGIQSAEVLNQLLEEGKCARHNKAHAPSWRDTGPQRPKPQMLEPMRWHRVGRKGGAWPGLRPAAALGVQGPMSQHLAAWPMSVAALRAQGPMPQHHQAAWPMFHWRSLAPTADRVPMADRMQERQHAYSLQCFANTCGCSLTRLLVTKNP